MVKKFELYAKILLKKCLDIKKGQPLLISAPIEVYEFIRILSTEAFKLGVSDIYYDFDDDILKKDIIKNCKEEVINENPFWNKKSWNDYTNKNAAFLMLRAVTPDIMEDVNSEFLSKVNINSLQTKKIFLDKQISDEISWTIACVATKSWADKLFPKEKDSLNKLWNTIFDICLINEENSLQKITEKINKLQNAAEKLNKLKLSKLHYKNSLGTDLTIELPESHKWVSAQTTVKDKKIICNFPSEEIYTCPKRNGVSGIVYSSKPLFHDGKIVEDFYLEFEKGKVINFDAKKGYDTLKRIINADKTSNMLGEVALVEYSSSISKTNIVFYHTLYDENASCHLALGKGYNACIENGNKKTKTELKKLGLNDSIMHVDFMVGTKDLEIIGYTNDNKEYKIFKNGNFSI